MLAGGLWWTERARERLAERFQTTVEEVVPMICPETLAMGEAGAQELRIGRLNMRVVLSGYVGANHVVTVYPIKEGAKKKRPRMEREREDEWC